MALVVYAKIGTQLLETVGLTFLYLNGRYRSMSSGEETYTDPDGVNHSVSKYIAFSGTNYAPSNHKALWNSYWYLCWPTNTFTFDKDKFRWFATRGDYTVELTKYITWTSISSTSSLDRIQLAINVDSASSDSDVTKVLFSSTSTGTSGTFYFYFIYEDATSNVTVTETLNSFITASEIHSTELPINSEFSFNYKVSGNEGQYYRITELTSNLGTAVIADDAQTANITGTASANITITGVASKCLKIVNSLTGVSSSANNPTWINMLENTTFTYTANDGFVIDDWNATDSIESYTLSSDKKTLTLVVRGTYDYSASAESITITVTGKSEVTTYSVTNNLSSGVTADTSNPTTIAENSEFILLYTVSDGYKVTNLSTTVGTISQSANTITVTGIATANIIVTIKTDVAFYIHISAELVHCTCNYADGDILDVEKNVIITPDDGYTFGSSKFTFKYKSITSQIEAGSDDTLTWLTSYYNEADLYLNDDAYTATKKVESVSAFTNLYRCTNDILNELAQVRFIDWETTSTVDYGSFITKLYRTNIDLTAVLSGDTDSIKLGNYDSKVYAETLNTYKYEIELGSITVPEKYGNVYDYINTTIELFVPFFNKVSLSVNDVIGKTVTIRLVFDLYNGIMTLVVYDQNDCIISSQNATIVTNIPFIQSQTNTVVNQLSNVYVMADTETYARVRVTRNIPYDVISEFGKSLIAYGLIGDYSGYTQVSDVDLITSATDDEKDQIISLLKGGVFIGS